MPSILSTLNRFSFDLAPLFYKIVFMSITAMFVGVAIVLLRKIFDKKISPFWKYAMWALVLVALLIPYRPQSDYAVVDKTKSVETMSFRQEYDDASLELKLAILEEGRTSDELSYEKVMEAEKKEKQLFSKSLVFDFALPLIWVFGIFLFGLYLTFTRLYFSKQLKEQERAQNLERINTILTRCKNDFGIDRNIVLILQTRISSPAITGIFKPTILLPTYCEDMSDESLSFIIYHELGHYKKGDIFSNTLLLLLQVVYWFNPVLWFIFKLIRDDMEVLNDEYVINKLGQDKSKAYARSLVEVLGLTNGVAIMPRLLCMVDDKKNIKRRISMIKEGENFKKKRLIIALASLLIIAVLGTVFLTTRTHGHTVEIYTIDSVEPDFGLDSIEGIITDMQDKYRSEYKNIKAKGVEPTLTKKDIVGYNARLRAFILSEDFIRYAKEKSGEEIDLHIFGGSVYLDRTNGKKGDFIIAVDGQCLYGGSLQPSVLSSMSSFGPILSDIPDGFMIGSDRWFWDENLGIDETMLLNAFKDMSIPIDAVPRAGLTGKEVYDVKELWENKCDFTGNDFKMEALIKALPLSKTIKYESFERDLDLYIYKDRNYSPNCNGLRIFLSGLDDLGNDSVLLSNAEILFALIDNLDFVEFIEDNAVDAPKIKGFVDSRNKELTDSIMPLNSNVYEMVWTGYKKLSSVEELFLYLEPFVIFGENTDYPHLIGKFSHQKDLDMAVAEPESLNEIDIYETEAGMTILEKVANKSEIEKMAEAHNPTLINEGIIFDAAPDENRELTTEELNDFNNRIFVTRERIKQANSSYRVFPTDITYMFSSLYERVEDINIADFIYYMPRTMMSDDVKEDVKQFDLLKNTANAKMFEKCDKISDWITPLGRVDMVFASKILKKYGNISFDDLSKVGSKDALYLEEYDYYYSYASDMPAYTFFANSGKIEGDEITLYWQNKHGEGKIGILKLGYDDEKAIWHIKSHTEE